MNRGKIVKRPRTTRLLTPYTAKTTVIEAVVTTDNKKLSGLILKKFNDGAITKIGGDLIFLEVFRVASYLLV